MCSSDDGWIGILGDPAEIILASILGYFDESGKFKDQRIVSFCGLASDAQRNREFNGNWRYWLRRFGLQETGLSMKDALNPRRPLSGKVAATGIAERTAALMNFADCIREHFELAIYVAIDVSAFTSLSRQSQEILGTNPHYIAFVRVIKDVAQHFRPELKIALVCDDEDTYSIECYKLYRKVKMENAAARKRFTAISFADDKDHPSLQAADMLASLTRRQADKWINRAPYDYQSLFDHLTNGTGRVQCSAGSGIFGQSELDTLSSRLLEAKRRGKRVGLRS